MSGNNTTAETCINALNETIDCIPLDSSSLLDDIEVVLIAVAALLGILAWGMKKYKELKTLDSHNVAELKAMLKEAGLSVSGKKADLVARLEAYKEGQ